MSIFCLKSFDKIGYKSIVYKNIPPERCQLVKKDFILLDERKSNFSWSYVITKKVKVGLAMVAEHLSMGVVIKKHNIGDEWKVRKEYLTMNKAFQSQDKLFFSSISRNLITFLAHAREEFN